MERSDVLKLKIVKVNKNHNSLLVVQKTIDYSIIIFESTVKMNLITDEIRISLNLSKFEISPYLSNYLKRFLKLYWLADCIKQALKLSDLTYLGVKLTSNEVILIHEGIPMIAYRCQTQSISQEELDNQTKELSERGIDCYWFFSEKANNKISESWSHNLYGEYYYLIQENNSLIVKGFKLHPNNSVGFPLNIQDWSEIVKKAVAKRLE